RLDPPMHPSVGPHPRRQATQTSVPTRQIAELPFDLGPVLEQTLRQGRKRTLRQSDRPRPARRLLAVIRSLPRTVTPPPPASTPRPSPPKMPAPTSSPAPPTPPRAPRPGPPGAGGKAPPSGGRRGGPGGGGRRGTG